MSITMGMQYTIDLDAPLYKMPARTLLVEGDKLANALVVEVVRGKEPVDLAGLGVTGEMIRTGEVMPLTGSISGNTATLTLPQACYAVPGGFELQMRLVNTADGITRTILILSGKIERKGSGTIIDVGEVVPNLDDLLAQIDAMKQATANANTAAAAANAAATEAVNIATSKGNEALQNVDDAVARQDEVIGQLSEEMGNALGKTLGLPCSFYSASDKLDITCEGYEGKKIFISNKNLLPQFPTRTNNGVTCTKNEDGSITLSGTSTSAASFLLSVNVMPQIGPGVYTLSANNASAIGDDLTYINIGINDAFGSIAAKLNEVDGKTTFTVNEGDSLIEMRIRIASGVTLPDNYTLYPQLEEGPVKTEFVKHEGFVLSPTSGEIEDTDCFVGYNYICAQAGVTGSVTFVQMQSEKLDDLEKRVEKLEAVEVPAKKYVGKTIVCFGDSITGNYLAPEDYPSMVASITGATVYNVGFGGCTMSYHDDEPRREFSMVGLVNSIVSGNFSAQENSGVSITAANGDRRNYVPERIATLKSIDWSTVDYITIAYGTNDWNSNYMIDNSENPLDNTSYIGAFRYSIEKLLTAYPNIKVLAITPLWRWWDETAGGVPYRDSDTYAKGTGWYLYDYGNALIEACKEYHIPCFDLYYECMMNKINRYVYFPANDGTHPNIVGRKLMAEKISARLESVY